MTDEVKAAVVADVAKVEAAPKAVEATVVATETKATTWIEKHPNYALAIAGVLALAIAYAVIKII